MSAWANAKVLIVGVGGLGVPAALHLARGGCRRITLLDPDRIDLSNLARQISYRTSDLGRSKAVTAAQALRTLCPDLEAEPIEAALTAHNGASLVARHDFIIDATDDPAAKFLINDLCLANERPFSYGGVLGWCGQTLTVIPGASACLRCLFEAPPDTGEIASCREAGILGPVAGLIGAIQGAEALALLAGRPTALAGRILTYDGRSSRARSAAVRPRPGCRCGAGSQRTAETMAGSKQESL